MNLSSISDKVRSIPQLREPLRNILTSLSIYRRGEKDDIIIFSCRRSGSTWLMELLGVAPKLRFVNEPFLSSLVAKAGLPTGLEDQLPISERKVVSIPQHAEDAYRHYLYEPSVTRTRGPYAPFSPQFHLISDRRVLKIIHATAIADWIVDQKPGFMPVYLIRHPLATAVSMTRSGMIARSKANLLSKGFCERYLEDELIALAESILATGSDLEKFVLEWCMDNLPLFKAHQQQSSWTLVSYEELVLEPESTIKYLCKQLNIPEVDNLVKLVNVPSASTVPNRREGVQTDSTRQITRWRAFVDSEAEQRAFTIIERFGFDVYLKGRDIAQEKYLRFLQ